MRGQFDYYKVVQAMDSIDVDDIGNCALRAFTDLGFEHILIIDTQLGTSRVFTFGPVLPDISEFPAKVECKYERMNYAESKLNKAIQTFINQPGITQVEQVDREEALEDCKSIVEYMGNVEFF